MIPAKPILVEISPGELFDKLTVLQVKLDRISEPVKLEHIRVELAVLEEARDAAIAGTPELDDLVCQLRSVNAELYDVIDNIYACARAGRSTEHFVDLARSVYHFNDRRALLKRKINLLLSSRLMEEKGHSIDRS